MEKEGHSSSEPVTALIVRNVKPERIEEFEKWALGMHHVVRGFEGYLGTDIIRPHDHAQPEFVIVVRFDRYEHLRAFMESTEREEWLKKSEEMTVGKMHVQEAQGFTPWFVLPDAALPLVTPPKYKMALLTILALYPSLLVLGTLLSYLFQSWPRPLLIFINVLILVPMMTYYIMPWVTRVFQSWLYPKDTAS